MGLTAPGGERGELRSEGASNLLYGRRHAFGLWVVGVTTPGHPSPSGTGVSGRCGAGSWYPDLPSEGGYRGTVSASPVWAAAGEAAGSLRGNTMALPNFAPSPALLICCAGSPEDVEGGTLVSKACQLK